MKLSFKDYEMLFDIEKKEREAPLNKGWYRTRRVKAGDVLYLDVYPMWDTAEKEKAAEALKTKKKDAAAIAKVNERNARRKFEQILNLNFGVGDVFATLTYPEGAQPENEKRAMADMAAYLRRLKRIREKRALDDLRYAYTMETTHSEAHGTKYHFHMVTGGDLDRETIENCWKKGIVNTKRVQRAEGAMSGIANYMTKQKETQKKGARRWNCSQNLKRPQATTNDHTMSRRKAEAIAMDAAQFGKSIFEQLFKGYKVLGDVSVRYSKYTTGAYISVRMERAYGHEDTNGSRGAEGRDRVVHHAEGSMPGA